MREISVDNVEPGMVVAENVITSASKILISAGTVITESLKKSLIKYNITDIMIEEEFSEEIKSQIEYNCWETVMKRFRIRPQSVMMKCLFDTAIKIEMSEYFDE